MALQAGRRSHVPERDEALARPKRGGEQYTCNCEVLFVALSGWTRDERGRKGDEEDGAEERLSG
jgi:hypothetical protein